MQTQERNIFSNAVADVAAFANRYSDPLLNALSGLVVGAVTAAITGNVIDGVKIAATGIGRLIIEIMKNPPATKSLGSRAKSIAQRLFSLTMLVPMLIAFVCAIAFMAAVLWAFNGQKPDDQIEQDIPYPDTPTIPDSAMPETPANSHIVVHNEDDDEFEDRSIVQNKAAILANDRYADGSTLAGCDRDGANMTRRVLEIWGAPEDVISHTLERYWASENGFYARVVHGNNELRVLRNNRATCARATKALNWTTSGMTSISKNFWYESMHGTTTPSLDSYENIDQCSVMFDFNWDDKSKWFLDNNMEKATKGMPGLASLLAMLDTCHAANFLRDVQMNGAIARFKTPPPEFFEEFLRGRSLVQRAIATDDSDSENVLLFAGCEADNVSYSNYFNVGGEQVMEGALTHNFLSVHAENRHASHEEIFQKVYGILANGKYVQRPQLQGSRRMRSTPFLV